jgi:hypothetical protein
MPYPDNFVQFYEVLQAFLKVQHTQASPKYQENKLMSIKGSFVGGF